MGLCSKELPKIKTEGSGANAATGTMKRSVAPDSPQSIRSFAPFSCVAPSTVQHSLATSTFAPNALTARSVASVSSENKGPDILEVPSESAAAMSILCVYALDGGAQTSPLSFSVLRIMTSTIWLSHDLCLFMIQTCLQNLALVALQGCLHRVTFVVGNHCCYSGSLAAQASG